jgi:D-alanine--poly(phosphoribitol) ligase subunit 1
MYIYNLGLLFYRIASEHPDRPAIRFSETEISTYRDINILSNRIARYLLDSGTNKNDVIGIFNNKSKESYALMLACLKIGAVYVNLDGSSPLERLNKIIQRCKPVLLAYDSEMVFNLIYDLGLRSVYLLSDDFQKSVASFDKADLSFSATVCSDNPAYIMFTSGSTGFPKGAVMTHQNLMNFISWSRITYNITKEDILSNVNPMYFDNSVFDFYGSLFNGASMAPVDADTVRQANKLVNYIGEIKATIWFSVPSLLVYLITMKALTAESFKGLRVITFGGEGFPKPKLKILFDLYSHRLRIVNVYGPTECTCICSSYDVNDSDFDDMTNLAPLGFMAPNFEYLILDEAGNTADSGELVLGGPQVGLGYYNDSDRTAKSFIQNPLTGDFRKIMYKTGDLVRRGSDGMIHISGRADNQIKLMGYRIELEEIEAGFNSLDYINESCVVYQKFDDGMGQLNAFVSLKATVSVDSIRNDIKQILPAYMVPKRISVMDVLPKNQNGKIDRVSLKIL